MQCGVITVQKFENGLRIAKRGGEEIIMDKTDASVVALHIRDYSESRLFTEPEVRVLLRRTGVKDYRKAIEEYDNASYEENWGSK